MGQHFKQLSRTRSSTKKGHLSYYSWRENTCGMEHLLKRPITLYMYLVPLKTNRAEERKQWKKSLPTSQNKSQPRQTITPLLPNIIHSHDTNRPTRPPCYYTSLPLSSNTVPISSDCKLRKGREGHPPAFTRSVALQHAHQVVANHAKDFIMHNHIRAATWFNSTLGTASHAQPYSSSNLVHNVPVTASRTRQAQATIIM